MSSSPHARLATLLVIAVAMPSQLLAQDVSCRPAIGAAADAPLVHVELDGVRLGLPGTWTARGGCPSHVHLAGSELDSVIAMSALREWDAEYDAVLNATLSSELPLLHAGDEPWGTGGLFRDLQMRVYRTSRSPAEIGLALENDGARAARAVAANRDNAAEVTSGFLGDWLQAKATFPLRFSDYGAPAVVDLFSKPCSSAALVIAFLYSEDPRWRHDEAITRILAATECG